MWLDPYSARYSTPENVAMYRSERLSGNQIIDIGSGAGMQSIFFSKNSKVIGLEINKTRNLMSNLNAEAFAWNKPTFIRGDFNDLKITDFEEPIIFSDPLRPVLESERETNSLSPNPESIYDSYGEISENFVFDLPPQMERNKIKFTNFESEYISVNGVLNRFTIYLGNLIKKRFSAVMLPELIRIES
ncbi:methyltransferase, partial [mine drainage metagenome]